MNQDNKVCIILVNYNGEKFNNECIDSILSSDYKNIEVIVVDNGSTDNSMEILRNLYSNKITIIENNLNLGFSGANNIGIKCAMKNSADFIMLLNNDTVINKDCISVMVKSSLENNMCVVSPKIYCYYDKKKVWSAGAIMKWNVGLPAQLGLYEEDSEEFNVNKYVEIATGCCLLIPKAAIEKIGLLSEEYFLYYEDTDYCIRLVKAGFKILYESKSAIYHKVSASIGGELSYNYIYYNTRNRLLFNHKFNSKNRLIYTSYFYFTRLAKFIIWAIKGKRELIAATVKAVRDYKNNNFGAIRK